MHMHHEHDDHHDVAPKEQLIALMKYMVGHNAEHTHELEHLALDIKEAGEESTYETIMEAVENYHKGNEILADALAKISE
ncbi:MAG: hypothetical protein MJ111_00115 [Clostridia bacterium]|nr:hypothetical protein [Candidatus Limimonas egerieequi]MCQ2488951.1 hypothetical protein [Clostridia bacterium]